jgi:hypothetical protein
MSLLSRDMRGEGQKLGCSLLPSHPRPIAHRPCPLVLCVVVRRTPMCLDFCAFPTPCVRYALRDRAAAIGLDRKGWGSARHGCRRWEAGTRVDRHGVIVVVLIDVVDGR